MIELQWHVVILSKFHTLLRLTPDDQAAWATDKRFARLKDPQGRNYLTLGAGPEGYTQESLVSRINRPNDAAPHSANDYIAIQPSGGGADENAFMRKLLELDSHFPDNLDYDFYPVKGNTRFWERGDGYNSNSYVSGLLTAAGVGPPTLPVDTPGFDKPVPSSFYTVESAARKAGLKR